MTQMVSQDGTSDYGYDANSQLTSGTHTYQTNESYSYDSNCAGPNYRRTFGRIKTVWIWPLIWRVDRIVENFGEDEADEPI